MTHWTTGNSAGQNCHDIWEPWDKVYIETLFLENNAVLCLMLMCNRPRGKDSSMRKTVSLVLTGAGAKDKVRSIM